MPNSLEENLRAVQTTKTYWKRVYDEEKDSSKRKQILAKIDYLNDEESRILKEIKRNGGNDGIIDG